MQSGRPTVHRTVGVSALQGLVSVRAEPNRPHPRSLSGHSGKDTTPWRASSPGWSASQSPWSSFFIFLTYS